MGIAVFGHVRPNVFASVSGLVVAAILLVVGVMFPATVSAQFDPLETVCQSASSEVCETDTSNPVVGEQGLLTRAATIIANVTAIVSVIIIVIAGLTMTLSSGNSQAIQSSRDAIIYAGVALAVAVLARAIIAFIVGSLT